MGIAVTICDDSAMARRQLAQALPDDWDADLTFADGGDAALDAVSAGHADILLLDLNMPGTDGYQVLERIRANDLSTLVIVVSGDIQPEAHRKVKALGALAFLQKPVRAENLTETLRRFGLYSGEGIASGGTVSLPGDVDVVDAVRELANVSMGQAADRLARLLDAFVVVPVPNVNRLEPSELQMAMASAAGTVSAVCQGFIGGGIAGEALLLFHDSGYRDLARLMRRGVQEEGADDELELLMDTANVLIGACLHGLAKQLDIRFSQGHPAVLGRHVNLREVMERGAQRRESTLAVEIPYRVENCSIGCDLLLLFDGDSVSGFRRRLGCR
ncbi:MAG: response regulator [Ectothiorhodospiraceae bacterium]|jgi:chemotaxis protein CheY-P-specific phosphatase CheC